MHRGRRCLGALPEKSGRLHKLSLNNHHLVSKRATTIRLIFISLDSFYVEKSTYSDQYPQNCGFRNPLRMNFAALSYYLNRLAIENIPLFTLAHEK